MVMLRDEGLVVVEDELHFQLRGERESLGRGFGALKTPLQSIRKLRVALPFSLTALMMSSSPPCPLRSRF